MSEEWSFWNVLIVPHKEDFYLLFEAVCMTWTVAEVGKSAMNRPISRIMTVYRNSECRTKNEERRSIKGQYESKLS